jgi:hypothetical protein
MVLYCIVLYCIVLCCVVLCCVVLCCVVLCCVVLYCIVIIEPLFRVISIIMFHLYYFPYVANMIVLILFCRFRMASLGP